MRCNIVKGRLRALGFLAIGAALAAPAASRGDAVATANVYFSWTDRVGGVHPAVSIFASGYDDDFPLLPDDAGSGYTNQFGLQTFTSSDIGLFDGTVEFYGFLIAKTGVGTTEWLQVRNNLAIKGFRWPATGTFDVSDPPGSANLNFTVDNTTFAGAAVGISQFATFERNYYANVHGANVPQIPIYYDQGLTGSFYQFNNRIQIDQNAWCSSDVIMHEFGHHIAFNNNMSASMVPPNPVPANFNRHAFGVDNIQGSAANMVPARSALNGTRLGWSEATASFLGLMAVREGNLAAKIPGLPGSDYDTYYNRLSSANAVATDAAATQFAVDFETRDYVTRNAAGALVHNDVAGQGEGDEMSVGRAMWDIYDNQNEAFPLGRAGTADHVALGAARMWANMSNSTTFEEFWTHITGVMDTVQGRALVSDRLTDTKAEAVSLIGEILEESQIAAVPDLAFNVTDDRRPLFEWDAQNNLNSAFFRVLLYSDDWTRLVLDSGSIASTGVVHESYRFAMNLANGFYHYVILDSPALLGLGDLAGIYRWYWSGALRFSIVPEPGAAPLVALGGGLILLARRWGRRRRDPRMARPTVPPSPRPGPDAPAAVDASAIPPPRTPPAPWWTGRR